MQERRNSIANALDLRLSCTNPSQCSYDFCLCYWLPLPVFFSYKATSVMSYVPIFFLLADQISPDPHKGMSKYTLISDIIINDLGIPKWICQITKAPIRSVSKIPQCTSPSPISHNASFCSRNVHVCFLTEFCYFLLAGRSWKVTMPNH